MSVTTAFPWSSTFFSGTQYYVAGMGDGQGIVAIAGTVAVANGSPNVTGTGTSFTTDLAVGQWVTFHSDTTYTLYQISSITSTTALVLTANYAATTNASTTLFQAVKAALCPLQQNMDIGVQVTADSCSLGYFVKSGTASPLINYSYDGSTFATVGTLTADSRFHTIALPAWPGGTVNLWLRVGGFTDAIVFNGDQLLTATTAAGSPSIAAVAALGVSPPGTLTVLQAVSTESKIQIEGYVNTVVWASDKTPHAFLVAGDGKLRFKARCSEIWARMYGVNTTTWVQWLMDGTWQGAMNYNDAQYPNVARVVMRNDTVFYWYKVAGGLDAGTEHEYQIAFGGGQARVGAVAVAGSFTGTTIRPCGTALAFGDSIWGTAGQDSQTIHFYVGENRNWSVWNYGTFGAYIQQSLYQDSRFPSISLQATTWAAAQNYRDKPGLILIDGGFNDAVHDQTVAPITWMQNQANFTATLTATLQAVRIGAPDATILVFNILPASTANVGATIRTTYNGLIAAAVSALADPKTILVDMSTISGYNVGGASRAHLTNALSGGVVQAGFTIDAAGSNFGNAQPVTISLVGGGGTGATATCTSSAGGTITSITLTSGGSGYTANPNVVVGDTWDGTHPNYNGYLKMWNQVAASIPAYSSGNGPCGGYIGMP